MNAALRNFWAPAVLAMVSPVVMAQLIEDVELRREGNNAVANIRFTTAVQVQRVIALGDGSVGQAYYKVLPTRDSLNLVSGQRRIGGAGAIPEITVIDEPDGRDELSRRLIVRLSKAVPYRIRTGKGNRSIEVVLTGLGESVRLAPVQSPAAAMAPERRYMITLQSSTQSGHFLEGSVPSTLGAYDTFTLQRSVDGQTVYDINLGYFANQIQAAEALALLRPRFPNARVVALQAPSGSEGLARIAPADVEARATELMTAARTAQAGGDNAAALEALGQLLNLPPNTSSRQAQAMIGEVRVNMGDTERARAELDAFLNLYPSGADSDRARALLAALPAKADRVQGLPARPESNWSGSLSSFYYGGNSKERSQEFQDSPISGLPELVGQNTFTDANQGQIQSNIDLNWRKRTTESDSRFVYRDAYTANLEPNGRNRRRLSALYFDQKSFVNGTNFRVGRQSPIGGGMLYRFDGAQAGYVFKPKWRINAAAGVPTDDLLQTKRRLYGVWLDADALTKELSGNVYFNQQTVDGEVDRRAVGTELRYFSGGLSMSSQIDYDMAIKGLNIVSLQGTWQLPDNTIYNFLFDKRTAPILSLGNILFFQDPSQPNFAQRVQDLLLTSSIDALRQQVKAVTANQTQALFGVTTPYNDQWQVGGNIRYTNVGAIPAVPAINFPAQPSTGNLWGVDAQLIGSNLYSKSDTHVFITSLLSGPTYNGVLLSYNNLTALGDGWRLEPSLRYYRQKDNLGTLTVRWTPAMRVAWRVRQQTTLESEVTFEQTRRTGAAINESSDRMYYYLGARYDF
ncbi:MAG: hypothetical protein DCF26_06750 [Burkholderiales bacterium]|nr:MAG: hypothetical protein DCF26_06750 [Burkholderiales bacterium]